MVNCEQPFTCHWIFDMLVVLCDGTVVCGCADPYGRRPLGRLSEKSVLEIWNSELVQKIRRELNEGGSPFCRDCGLKRYLKPGESVPQRPVVRDSLPRLFIEPTVLCNLSCYKSVCSKESGIIKTRRVSRMDLSLFRKILEETGQDLVRIDLFNYGETFLHPEAVDMVEIIKSDYPHIYLYASTNGLPLTESKLRRITAAKMDEITFSIDGVDQKTYVQYRRGGDFRKVIDNLSRLIEIREELGSDLPFINWRYILFRWNDSWWKMFRARRMAKKLGVDRLTWEITDHPADAASRHYRPGTRAWRRIYYEIWDTSQLSNAIKSRRCRARIVPIGRLKDIHGEVGRATPLKIRVENTGGAIWRATASFGRRLVRLGAQLYDSERRLLNRDFARAFLPHDIPDGNMVDVEIELPPVTSPGRYLLKFDMVSEGIDWFESAGSPVYWCPFRVSRKDQAPGMS